MCPSSNEKRYITFFFWFFIAKFIVI
jgi:hypothetical protein